MVPALDKAIELADRLVELSDGVTAAMDQFCALSHQLIGAESSDQHTDVGSPDQRTDSSDQCTDEGSPVQHADVESADQHANVESADQHSDVGLTDQHSDVESSDHYSDAGSSDACDMKIEAVYQDSLDETTSRMSQLVKVLNELSEVYECIGKIREVIIPEL